MKTLWLLGLWLGLVGCTTPPTGPVPPALSTAIDNGASPPAAPRELRGAWVASVANIDWPSKPGLPVAQQQAEITALLDQASKLKLNAILLQVRPSADALYPSALEPWSEYLSGEQGRPPEPFYDPLALWIAQAHARGIELHAWINPYRARHGSAKSALHATHIANTHPEAVKAYGEALWMDPAEPAARAQTLAVVADLVRRYDLDGVHIDDYFYPYPVSVRHTGANGEESQSEVDFPDGAAWDRAVAQGATLSRADWRRQQVNDLIQAMDQTVHQIKPWLRFGISPFGLGRLERRASGISGFSQYDAIYADAETWLAKGWLDYLAPQLYWPIDQAPQAFATLLQTWVKENVHARHLWPGLFTSRIDASAKSWQPQEILNQIALTRHNAGASGHIHFSMAALLQDRLGVSTLLKSQTYVQAALPPASPWLEADAPTAPSLTRTDARTVQIHAGAGKAATRYAVWERFGRGWRFLVQPAAQELLDIADDGEWGAISTIVVSAVDRVGNEGPRTTLRLSNEKE